MEKLRSKIEDKEEKELTFKPQTNLQSKIILQVCILLKFIDNHTIILLSVQKKE